MIEVASAPLSLLLYGVVALAWVAVARWLGRPIPGRLGVGLLILPALFLLPAFVTTRTIYPIDHAISLPPWSVRPHPPPANPNLNDVATQIGPWAKAVRMAWKEGSLPWRNRWNGCGTPLAANGQSAAFSPLTFLMGLLPLAFAFNFAAAVKLFTVLSGAWLWLSELGVRRNAAFLGAVLFGFSLTMVPLLLFPLTSVVALWPWSLFVIERLRNGAPPSRAIAALAGIFVLEFLSGHPESVVLGLLFIAVWLISRLAAREITFPGQLVARVAIALAIGGGLSAFLLVPELAAIRDSNRAFSAAEILSRLPVRLAPHGPAFFHGFFTPVLPRSLGDAMANPMLPPAVASFPEMALAHFGLIGWVGALLSFRRGPGRSRKELAMLGPLVAGMAVATLLWPIFDLFFVLPGVKLILPLRFFSWAALAGSALAAFAVDRLARDVEQGRANPLVLIISAGTVLGIAGAIAIRLYPVWAKAGALASQRRELGFAAAFLLAAALTGVVFRSAGRLFSASALPVVLAVVAVAELFWQGRRLYRWETPGNFYPPTPLIEFLGRQPGPFRVLGEGPVIFPGTNVFAGVEDVRTHDAVERRDYVEWLDRACGYESREYFKRVAKVDCAALDLLNVKYLVAAPGRPPPGPRWRLVYAGEDGTVFQNLHVRPRVFPAKAGAARVTGYRETTNTAVFRADVAGDGAILLSSLVQDGGWIARDERGTRLPVSRTNGPFLSVTVPGGSHTVRLEYSPPGVRLGLAVSVASAVLALSAALWKARRGDR